MIESLEKTEETRYFKFRSGYVQIKGGKRLQPLDQQNEQHNSRQRRNQRRNGWWREWSDSSINIICTIREYEVWRP